MILTGLILGAVLGVVLQRGRFCVTGMLRDVYLQKSWRTFVALLIVISVHAVGIAALTSLGIIAPDYDPFRPLATVVGGFVFGIGIVLAGGCASGTWYRSAEGLVGSWVALMTYGLSAAAMKTGALTWLNDGLRAWETELTTLPALLGVSPWFFAIGLSLFTIVLVRNFVVADARLPRVASLRQQVWRRPLHVYVAGVLVGVLGVIAWPLSAATGRNDGLGITTPTSNLFTFFVTGEGTRVDWGVMLVLGIFIGALIAAVATGEFRVRVPEARTMVNSLVGGVLMGVGAAAAGGCTVGNGMVQTSLFSFQGWIALLFIGLGVAFAAKLWLKPAAAPVKDAGRDSGAGVGAAGTAAEARGSEVSVATASEDTSADALQRFDFPVATGAVALKTKSAVSSKLRDLGNNRYALDSLGAVCPFPLIEAKDVMKTLSSGDELVIDFDCTQATDAIPQWAARDGHSVTDFHATGEASWQITVRKG